jgi:hypothetical protein
MTLLELENLGGLTQQEVIPMYANLITTHNIPDGEIGRVNAMIMNKWSNSGLILIKDKAWRIVKQLKKGQHMKF